MSTEQYPRSPKIQVGGLCHLGRLFDKIRMRHAGLIQDYHYLTEGFDKYLLELLQIEGQVLENRVLGGGTDDELLGWIEETGKAISNEEREQWNRMVLTGTPQNEQAQQRFDQLVAHLARDRGVRVDQLPKLTTWVDVIECDEGRL